MPFQCSYCKDYFCDNHRLPENHQCLNLPKQPKFWYQKKKLTEKQTLLAETKVGVCPKCGSIKSEMRYYDAKTMTFECVKCGHEWCQIKSIPHHIIEPKVKPRRQPAQRTTSTVKEKAMPMHKPQFESRIKIKRKAKNIIYSIILIVIIIAIGLFVYANLPLLTNPQVTEPQVNMRQKIKDELAFEGSILEYDWVVWSKTAKDSGMVFTKMDTWEQFKESYRQSIGSFVIMLDQQNRVVWFKAYINHVIYYEY